MRGFLPAEGEGEGEGDTGADICAISNNHDARHATLQGKRHFLSLYGLKIRLFAVLLRRNSRDISFLQLLSLLSRELLQSGDRAKRHDPLGEVDYSPGKGKARRPTPRGKSPYVIPPDAPYPT